MAPSPTEIRRRARSRRARELLAKGGAVALVMWLAPHAALGETAEEAQRRLDTRRNELQRVESRAKSLEQDVHEIAGEREKLNERLLETAALIQKSEARSTAIEARLGELDAQERLLKGSLDQRRGQISKLLSALLRMGRNPPPVMITQRADALQMVRSAMLVAFAFPELRGQALALATRLSELVRVMTDIRSEGDRLKAETERLGAARTRLAGLMDSKKQSLAEREAELQQVRVAAADIARSVGDLNELISKLDKTVTEKTGLGAYEKTIESSAQATVALASTAQVSPPPAAATPPAAVTPAAATAPPPAVTPPPAGVAEISLAPAASDPDKATKVAALTVPKPAQVIELVPGAGAFGKPGRISPAMPFEKAKARLPLPAQGRRVLAFGEKTQYGSQSKGIVLETRHRAQITSPCDGWVVYAGEFRSYGQLLIINAGAGYHVLLAGLSQIDVQPGQFVLAAEPVGTMSGNVTKAQDSRQDVKSDDRTADKARDTAPVLYVEFRKNGRPIDPDPWWVESHQKVQG